MNRKVLVVKNSTMGLLSQVMTIMFAFITRHMFIEYIGVELLGINTTFNSVLSALSLSELGFEAAVIYSLYRPMHDDNKEKINDIINILKIIYRCIGGIFILGSIGVLPFLKYILVDIEIAEKQIYIFFLLQSSASVCTYFLAYKRTLLYANQKEYVSKIVDMLVNCFFNVLQCLTILKLHNYYIYLFLKIGQIIVSNLIIHSYCHYYYSYLHKDKINKEILKDIIKNVKNIFVGKIAGFIYSSTDNLVISTFINTVSVVYYGNYTTIVLSLKNMTNGLLAPISPIIGNYLVEEKSNENKKNIFLLYTHVRFWISLLLIIPTIVLIEDFIVLWIGEEFVLPSSIIYLLGAEFYIHLVHSATIDFINGIGLFKLDKYIELAGAFSNIILSILLVRNLGIAGVIVGTVLSQFVFWAGRSTIVYFCGLLLNKKDFFSYWMRNLYYCIVFVLCTKICHLIYFKIALEVSIVKIVLGGFLCEICILMLGIVMLKAFYEQKQLLKIVVKIITKKRASIGN